MTSYLMINEINDTRIIKIYISEMIKLSIKYEYSNGLVTSHSYKCTNLKQFLLILSRLPAISFRQII